MPYTVDFNTVSTVGLESSPVPAALAGPRANEARYFKNKFDHVFTVEPASKAEEVAQPGVPESHDLQPLRAARVLTAHRVVSPRPRG